MTKCSYCGENIQVLPFKCPHCGKAFCVHHRLSDNHECSNDLAIEKIQDSIQKKALEREKVSKNEDLVEELNRELKLLVEMGFISSEKIKKGHFTDLDWDKVYPDNDYRLDYYTFNFREYTRNFANNDGHSIIIGNYNVIGLRIYQDKIPESFKSLKKLKILVIDNANMIEFPKALAQLRNLRYLYIKQSNITDIPNLSVMFPKLIYLGLNGVKLQSSPDWLFEFARKHHSRHYLRNGIGDINQIPHLIVGWIKTVKFNRGVDKKDAAVLGFLEILTGSPIVNDQPEKRITNQSNVFNESIWPKMQREMIRLGDNKLLEKYSKKYPEEPPERYLTLPWDYNDREGRLPRYTLNDSGNVIGLDIALLYHEGEEILLPYFPEEICKLHNLQVLRIGFQYPQIYPDPDSEYHYSDFNNDLVTARIPNSIRKLKELRYFWTNAGYSSSLKPFLNTLKEFGHLKQEH